MANTASIEFDRTPNGDGFALSRTTSTGKKTRIPLTWNEVLGLQETIAIFQAQILSQFQSEWGAVQPIYVLDVSGVRVMPEALGERVLLTLLAPTGHETTHALPREVARHIAGEIPAVLTEMSRPTSRQ